MTEPEFTPTQKRVLNSIVEQMEAARAMKIDATALQLIADALCRHHDRLPAGVDVTDLRLAMLEFAHVGHLGCRARIDSVSCVGEVEEGRPGDFASDREAKSV